MSDNFVMVPRVPTDEMLKAGCCIPGVSLETGRRMWSAMLTSAPPAPAGDGQGKALAIAKDMAEAFDKLRVSTVYSKADREIFSAGYDDAVEIASLLTPAPAAEDGWREIASAPKDGTLILLWLGSPWSDCVLGRWYKPWSNWQAGTLPYDPARQEYHGIGSSVPTHWMPLPAPPTPTTEEAAEGEGK